MQYTSLHHKHTKPQCNKITTIWSSTPRFKINVHFETQECIGAILFSVGPGFDRNGCIGTRSGTALRTIMVSLPQLILGHVILQHNPSRIPLGTGTANRGEATCDGTLVRGFAHGNFVSGTLFGVWQWTETKDEGKRQWGTKDPNAIPQSFYGRSNRFEYGTTLRKRGFNPHPFVQKLQQFASTILLTKFVTSLRFRTMIASFRCYSFGID